MGAAAARTARARRCHACSSSPQSEGGEKSGGVGVAHVARLYERRLPGDGIPLLQRSYVPHVLAWNAHLAGYFGYFKLPVYRYLGARARLEETVPQPSPGSPPCDHGCRMGRAW